MFEFVEILLQKRWFVIAGAVVTIDLLLVSLLAPTLQAHHASITARINAAYADQAPVTYDSPNVVTNGLSLMANDAGHAASTTEVNMLKGAVSVATGLTRFNKDVGHGARVSAAFTLRSASDCAVFTARAIGTGFAFTGRTVGDVLGFAWRTVGGGFGFAGRGIGNVFGFFGGLTHVSSVIRPADHTPTPTITQLRLQQVALIEQGTTDVSVASVTSGVGGACDSGDGNGGYLMKWCNAPMDSIATVPYSSDPINRECTSYAYWYFTSVEGHTGFWAQGDAKYWAATSNYPTRTTPTVGAIAVETAGAYGHVAIVQALPGQQYAGRTVPAGYVLVSEMNYDWAGHFRYSYSPLSKFSAYIYP